MESFNPSGFTISESVFFASLNSFTEPPEDAVTVREILDVERKVTDISIQNFPPFTLVCTDRLWVKDSLGEMVRIVFEPFLMAAIDEMLIVEVTLMADAEIFTDGLPGFRVAFIPARE